MVLDQMRVRVHWQRKFQVCRSCIYICLPERPIAVENSWRTLQLSYLGITPCPWFGETFIVPFCSGNDFFNAIVFLGKSIHDTRRRSTSR
ncbi:uncharacterized protein ACIB01_010007 [Guaruba guarouba]